LLVGESPNLNVDGFEMEIRSLNYLYMDEHAQLKYRLVAYVNASLQPDYRKAAKRWVL
jgi:hypothetical protein